MIRIGTIIWFVVLAMLGVGLFQVKYAVQAKERDLRAVNRQITADRQILRVLEAEWSYLNDPVRLADLTRRHTDLVPAMASQIAGFDSLRERPADQPLPEDPLLAGSETPLATVPGATVPASITSVDPVAKPAEDNSVFTTSAGAPAVTQPVVAQPAATQEAAAPVDEDATIRAILADMEAKQNDAETNLPTTTSPASGGDGAE